MKSVFFFLASGIWASGALWAQLCCPRIPEIPLDKPFVINMTAIGIFLNNLKMLLFNISGLVSCGIPTLFTLLLNGFVFGLLIRNAVDAGLPLHVIGFKTLPHFPEYIAIWLSGAIGLSGMQLFIRLTRSGTVPIIETDFKIIMKFILLCLLCIFMAALIEKNIILTAISWE